MSDRAFKRYQIHILGNTIMIMGDNFNFSYTPADDIVKDEFKGKYTYFGGLQCNYGEGTEEYREIESRLITIAQAVLKANK